ncbi:MAG: ATP-binding cassette domain-containing protein, partial [Deltaproteobacteria bacterium]|nr:ATP-binding cassette domain-containing protein [Deltaproteobacteria bacterium]
VLQDIDLTIRAGEVVAFVGLSGVGKTTLVNLLPRFYDVTTGRITVDGIDLRDATIASLRRQIALVPQETTLFNDTVRNNIALGWPSASVEDVVRAAQAANAHDFICGLPQGYDTVIGEAGGLLSGGQRQRLALSRAFVRNAPIVILDEATSQLDAESEQLVSTAIANLLRDRTVLLIAHRLSTVRHAHRIVMMHEGRIVDDGTHDELLTRNPLYRRLTELQFATPSHHPRRLIA